MTQHAGIALSYLNLYDADAAWLLVHDMDPSGGPACAIIKHANPCGAAIAETLAEAYQLAFECDERSAFGGIVAVNRPIDDATVERMVAAAQADVVIAPATRPASSTGSSRSARTPASSRRRHPCRTVATCARHRRAAGPGTASLRVATLDVEGRHRRQPTETELDDAELAFRSAAT